MQHASPLTIYHEHPNWFRPLFAELDRRGIPYRALDARAPFFFDPADSVRRYPVFFNRMSPSAYLREGGSAIFHTLNFLAHLERVGTRVINGLRAFTYEISKARQLTLLAELGLPGPRSRVIHRASDAPDAARDLRFPVVVKANIGGSGAGIVRYDSLGELEESMRNDAIDLGLDRVALVQEYITARDGHITRVETLGGKFLYAINVYPEEGSFDLCPADACQTTTGVELVGAACAVDAVKSGLRVEGFTPSAEIIEQVERIAQYTGLDIGGIEYLVDDRDGKHYFYDINALSNFVADAPNVIGFDPFARLADYLELRAGFRGALAEVA